MQLPVPSFDDRPVPYLVCYFFILLSACLWPLNFFQSNQVTWEPDGGLRFTPPATAYTLVPPLKLTALHQWTIFMDVKIFPPLKQARILSYSLGDREYNLNVEQLFDDLVVRIRTGKDQKSREMHVAGLFGGSNEERFQLAIVYNGEEASLYLDGKKKASHRIGAITDSSWDASFPLVLGSRADGKLPWKGIFYHLAVFDRVVSLDELKEPPTLFANSSTVLRYSFDEFNGTTINDQGAVPPAAITMPGNFIPYKRTILQSPRDYWPDAGRPYLRDIIANIIIYLPIGYLLSVWMARNNQQLGAMAIPLIAGFGISLTIELLQAFLPTRNSSSVDLAMNTLGTYLGMYARHNRWAEKLLKKLNVSFRQTNTVVLDNFGM